MIKVKTSKTSPLKGCTCGSLLNHWKKFTGQQVRMCLEADCRNHEVDGSYVTKSKTDSTTNEQIDSAIYLIPLCQEHRESKEELDILDTCIFVTTDLKTTCGRRDSKELKEGEL